MYLLTYLQDEYLQERECSDLMLRSIASGVMRNFSQPWETVAM
jgi:hypothetical protein